MIVIAVEINKWTIIEWKCVFGGCEEKTNIYNYFILIFFSAFRTFWRIYLENVVSHFGESFAFHMEKEKIKSGYD